VLPLYLADHKERTAAALKMAHELEAKVEHQHEDKVRNLLFQLNKYNASNQQHLRAAYLVYSAAPCERLETFIRAVEDVREFDERLTQAEFLMQHILSLITKPAALKALQKNNPDSDDQLALMFARVIDTLARPAYVGRVMQQMSEVPAKTEEWAR
jgi:hypothetical protein